MINKIQEKKLRAIAKMLPGRQYAINSKAIVTGEDLLLSGHKEVEGKEIDPMGEYLMPLPFYNEVNHYRRLKRSFERNGKKGVIKYLTPYVREPEKLGVTVDYVFG